MNREAIALNDLAAICLAIAELVVTGRAVPSLRATATVAIDRQTAPPFLEPTPSAERRAQVLRDVKRMLQPKRGRR